MEAGRKEEAFEMLGRREDEVSDFSGTKRPEGAYLKEDE
jgi:hypothetical protein